jgi:hypothetical protein
VTLYPENKNEEIIDRNYTIITPSTHQINNPVPDRTQKRGAAFSEVNKAPDVKLNTKFTF